MQRSLCVAAACGLVLAGCGSNDRPNSAASGPRTAVSIPAETLPVTVEGMFALSVERGDVDSAGVSEINFGTPDVKGAMHLVQLSGAVLSVSGLGRDSGMVRATLGARTDAYGAPTYIVTAMTKVGPPQSTSTPRSP